MNAGRTFPITRPYAVQMHNPEMRTVWVGYGSVALAALLWALSGNAAKFLFKNGVSPFQLVQLRTTVAAVCLFLWLLFWKRSLLRIRRKDIIYFVMLGIILAAVQFTYLYTISRIPVAAAILIQYQSPMLIALHARIFRKKQLSGIAYLAIAGALIGCYMMVGGYNMALLSMNKAGILSGVASSVVFAWYAVKSEDGLHTYSPWTLLSYGLLVAAVVWNILQPPFSSLAAGYDIRLWPVIIYIGIFGTVIPFGLYNVGIRAVAATYASVTATLEPVFAGFIAYLLLGEVLELWQIIGAGVVIGSILLLQVRKGTREQT